MSEDEELMRIRAKKLEELLKQRKHPSSSVAPQAAPQAASPPSSTQEGGVAHLTDRQFVRFIQSDKFTIIDFYADWCRPCKMMAPVLEELSYEFHDVAQFGKINVDHYPAIASKYGAQSIPLFIIFRNGAPLKRIVGAVGPNPFRNYLLVVRERLRAEEED